MKPPNKKRLGYGRVAFLARSGAIKEKIDAGYTMAAIYEEHQQQLDIGYKQFCNYVNKYIRNKQTKPKEKETQDGNRRESIGSESKPEPANATKSAGTVVDSGSENELEERASDADFF